MLKMERNTIFRRSPFFFQPIVCLAVAGGFLLAWDCTGQPKPKERYIVTLQDDVSPHTFAQQHAFKPVRTFDAFKMIVQDLDEDEVAALRQDKRRVRFVEKDGPVSVGPITKTAAVLSGQTIPTGLQRMAIPQFPVAHINGSNELLNVDVAIIDTGIDPHEDLDTYQTHIEFGVDGSDAVGHGTAVAGIVAAKDNGIGVVGVAPGVRLWNIKTVGPPPNDSWTSVLAAMNYVYQHSNEISVVNISITNEGSSAPTGSLRLSIRRLVRAGIVVVAAAGNNNRDLAGPDGEYTTNSLATDDAVPAAFAEAMAVSAMDPTGDVFWVQTPGTLGSNYSSIPRPVPTNNPDPTAVYPVSNGGAIDVAAPGVNIPTTAPGVGGDGIGHNYAYATGTSFAAPHVTGLVALYIAANGRAYDEKGVYKIRQAIIDQSQALQPQSVWAHAAQDPDTNHEALAYPSEAWVPKPVMGLVKTNSAVELTISTGSPTTCDTIPCSIPGYNYTVQTTSEMTNTNWSELVTLAGDGTAFHVTDSNPNPVKGFYRVKISAAP